MKSVLISIKPKWCEKIARGEKTIEVRKTAPKEMPFKTYIYCTYGNDKENYMLGRRGKIIGEFVCDKILEIEVFKSGTIKNYWFYNLDKSCLSLDEMGAYIGKENIGYGWHISDLKIYDKPKELSEFGNLCRKDCLRLGKGKSCEFLSTDGTPCNRIIPITRPPQSWCYVEEQSNDRFL